MTEIKKQEDTLFALTSERVKMFCPIIKDNCRDDCVCFESGSIQFKNDYGAFGVGDLFPIPIACGPTCAHVAIEGIACVEHYNSCM